MGVADAWTAPYDVAVDKNGDAWTGSMLSDRVSRLDPKTGQFTEYCCRGRPHPARVRGQHDDAGHVLGRSNHGASIIKLEPLE